MDSSNPKARRSEDRKAETGDETGIGQNSNQGFMKTVSDTTDTNAAAPAVGRELIFSVLQRNPIIAVAAALIGPILGLFRRRRVATTTEVDKLRVERFHSQSLPLPAGAAKGAREATEGLPKDYRGITEGLQSSKSRSRPAKRARVIGAASPTSTGGSRHG